MKKRILVADDDDGIRASVVSLLIDHDFEVDEAQNESDILANVDKCDLWLIDIRLPTKEYEGILAVYSAIKEQKVAARPIIFMSVDDREFAQEDLNGLQKLGISFEWINKPFEHQELLQLIERQLAR